MHSFIVDFIGNWSHVSVESIRVANLLVFQIHFRRSRRVSAAWFFHINKIMIIICENPSHICFAAPLFFRNNKFVKSFPFVTQRYFEDGYFPSPQLNFFLFQAQFQRYLHQMKFWDKLCDSVASKIGILSKISRKEFAVSLTKVATVGCSSVYLSLKNYLFKFDNVDLYLEDFFPSPSGFCNIFFQRPLPLISICFSQLKLFHFLVLPYQANQHQLVSVPGQLISTKI